MLCFINTKPPYLVRFFALNPHAIESEGEHEYRRALDIYRKCTKDENWPVNNDIPYGDIEEL